MLGSGTVWERLRAFKAAKVTPRPGEAFRKEVSKAGVRRQRLTGTPGGGKGSRSIQRFKRLQCEMQESDCKNEAQGGGAGLGPDHTGPYTPKPEHIGF